MIPDYRFRTAPPDPRTTRLLHWLFYLGALLLLVAAVHSLYRYLTEWTAGDDNSHLWDLLLGIVYLIASGLIAYATYRHGSGPREELAPERYADIKDGILTYQLDQLSGTQRIDLGQVRQVTKPSVRELVLTTEGGERHVLPIYLIDEEEKQRELEGILKQLG